MRKFIGFCLAGFFLASCNSGGNNQEGKFYGKEFETSATIKIEQLEQLVGKGSVQKAKVEAVVESVCQAKGCWMDLKRANGPGMRVTFKDYDYFVPKNISGKTAIVNGIAWYDTTTVEDLRHYAEDAGKSATEIAAITQPQLELVFEAEGVFIK